MFIEFSKWEWEQLYLGGHYTHILKMNQIKPIMRNEPVERHSEKSLCALYGANPISGAFATLGDRS